MTGFNLVELRRSLPKPLASTTDCCCTWDFEPHSKASKEPCSHHYSHFDSFVQVSYKWHSKGKLETVGAGDSWVTTALHLGCRLEMQTDSQMCSQARPRWPQHNQDSGIGTQESQSLQLLLLAWERTELQTASLGKRTQAWRDRRCLVSCQLWA